MICAQVREHSKFDELFSKVVLSKNIKFYDITLHNVTKVLNNLHVRQ